MSCGPFYRQTPEYQTILEWRALQHIFGADYPKIQWLEEVLARLEVKAWDEYTDRDDADFAAARDLLRAINAKYSPNQPPALQGNRTASEEHITTHYIWHTQEDSNVRPEHAANDG